MSKRLFVSLLLVSSTAIAAEPRPELRHVYQLEFNIAENDGHKNASSTTYTLNLDEHRTGEIKVGTNVALAGPTPGPPVRTDIGLTLRASFVTLGDELLVDDELEMSAASDSSSFHKIATKGNALVSVGKPALIASVEDPISHKHYQLTVKATKLR